jgi:16S rRNA (cytosine1402-N4)-methyltransferase
LGSASLTSVPARPATPHEPVLVAEVIGTLAPTAGQTIVDCTFGAGGHARRLAPLLGRTGAYLAIDRDASTEQHFTTFSEGVDCHTRFIRADFAEGLQQLADEGIQADGILMDLGISSMQVDQPERGFSYSRNAPLDMRMDASGPGTAADLLAEADEDELIGWFRTYGEERYAKGIARSIVRRRQTQPITSTCELVELIRGAIPTPALFAGGHPAKRVFQALRIVVNDELGLLERGLDAAFELLAPGGRLVVISFHSLEDRIVKRFMQAKARGCICPPDLPQCVCGHEPEGVLAMPKALAAKRDELERNPRAQSARMRAMVKVPVK